MVVIGKIVRTIGNRGEMALASLSDSLELQEREKFVVEMNSRRKSRPGFAEYVSLRGGTWRLKLAGIDTISAALPFIGYVLSAEPSGSEKTPPDLTGFRVFDRQGSCWGSVIQVFAHSQNPLLELEADNGRQVIIPFQRPIIRRISPKLRRILIDPPEGLRDLNP